MKPSYRRAIYYPQRQSFVVDDAGWLNVDTPNIEYRFRYDSGAGMLTKMWVDDEETCAVEDYVFGHFDDQTTFDHMVQVICQSAHEISESESLDYFTAVIEEVKEYSEAHGIVAASPSNQSLFWNGLEDAYTRRDLSTPRLHQRVDKSQKNCWGTEIVEVFDPNGTSLGWAVIALICPDLTSSASVETRRAATVVEILELVHRHTQKEAYISQKGVHDFMTKDGRVQDPEYAALRDRDILESISVACSQEKITDPPWHTLTKQELQALHTAQLTLTQAPQRWHPIDDDSVDYIAEEYDMPRHLAEQYYARYLDSLNVDLLLAGKRPWWHIEDD